jgi:hypothetical protein
MSTHERRDDRLRDQYFWSGHANPWSVWTFVIVYPMLILAIYRRNRTLLTGILLFVAINPLVFSPPPDDHSWATRVVLGERVWLEHGNLWSTNTLFTAASAPVYLLTLKSAVEQRRLRTAVGTVASMILMFVFFQRMVQLYESQTNG